MALVGTVTINSVELELHASKNGRWQLWTPGQEQNIGWGDTLDQAKAQARKTLAKTKVKVSVPFINHGGERGVATGIHSSSRNIIARIDGKSYQLSGYQDSRMLNPAIPAETLERYLTLRDEIAEREKERWRITKDWEFDLRSAVSKALEEAVSQVTD